MHRSDRIYLSRFALDPDPEYIDLDDFDLECVIDEYEFYDEISPDIEQNMSTKIRRFPSNEDQTLK